MDESLVTIILTNLLANAVNTLRPANPCASRCAATASTPCSKYATRASAFQRRINRSSSRRFVAATTSATRPAPALASPLSNAVSSCTPARSLSPASKAQGPRLPCGSPRLRRCSAVVLPAAAPSCQHRGFLSWHPLMRSAARAGAAATAPAPMRPQSHVQRAPSMRPRSHSQKLPQRIPRVCAKRISGSRRFRKPEFELQKTKPKHTSNMNTQCSSNPISELRPGVSSFHQTTTSTPAGNSAAFVASRPSAKKRSSSPSQPRTCCSHSVRPHRPVLYVQLNGAQSRPFYVVAHNPNSLD